MLTIRAACQFWLLWTVTSALATGVGFVAGLAAAYLVGAVVLATVNGLISGLLPADLFGRASHDPVDSPIGWVVALVVGTGTAGALIGLIGGYAQSRLLPWQPVRRDQWVRKSTAGWSLGVAAGFVFLGVLNVVVPQLVEARSIELLLNNVFEIVSPIAGLVLGWMLRGVPPDAPVRLRWWLPGHAVALSGGWIVARIVSGQPSIDTFGLAGLILSVTWYGLVSGLMMLQVLRDCRPEAPRDPVGAI
jgi:hypothetical protein